MVIGHKSSIDREFYKLLMISRPYLVHNLDMISNFLRTIFLSLTTRHIYSHTIYKSSEHLNAQTIQRNEEQHCWYVLALLRFPLASKLLNQFWAERASAGNSLTPRLLRSFLMAE